MTEPGAAPPLVGVSACARTGERNLVHGVAEQYVRAVRDGAGAVPVMLPALGDESALAGLVDRLDGLFLTGSPSNVEPHRYGGDASRPGTLHDPWRDATTLPLIRRALAAGLPLLAVCRGHQELNVALGGTLHQNVHELPDKRDHRSDPTQPNAVRYAPVHPVGLVPGGLLHRLAGGAAQAMVNSLHAQAIDRLAPGLAVEAAATDGVIEAVRVTGAAAFALGVQWHPEWGVVAWQAGESGIAPDPLSRAIFAAFAEACRARAARRSR